MAIPQRTADESVACPGPLGGGKAVGMTDRWPGEGSGCVCYGGGECHRSHW